MTDNETRAELRRVLAENGIDDGAPSTLHSWRCEHVGRYGACDCLDGLLNDLAVLVSPAIPADTAALIAEARNAAHYLTKYAACTPSCPSGEHKHDEPLYTRLADALESQAREVERLRMALREKEHE